ncbi:ankyrin [Acephala macrosclerotiorum]|nr:ankyrin [Acephala macrosclerotiorum]
MVFLLDLPNELVFEIVKHLDQQRDIKSIAFVSRRYYSLFNDDVYRFNISSRGGRGILWAIAHDQASAVGKFLDLGLDMNTVPGCNRHSTLLHLAVHHDSLSAVKLLLHRGADINAKDGRRVTPLFKALTHRHDEIVRAICERIVDFGKVLVDFGKALTPLHAACRSKLPNAARFFLELGDDLQAKDIDGKSPLYHALSDDMSACHPRSGDGDAVFDTVMVLLEFGVKLDPEHSRRTLVSTFQLGINHENPRVRELVREKRDKTQVIAHGAYIGHAWMSLAAGEYDVSSNRLSRYRHSSNDLDAGIDFLSKRPSETFISPCSGCDKPLEPRSDRRGEYAELTGNSFPALSNVSPSPIPSAQSTTGIWSHSNVQQLVARISLTEAKAKAPLPQKVRQTDPYPQLAETPLSYFSMEAKEKWARFRNPLNGDRVEGSHVMCPDPGDRLDEGRRHKARGRKSWKPLKLW